MFFRRERPKKLTFDDHMAAARAAGFRTESAGGGRTRVERNGVAAVAEPGMEGVPRFVVRAGIAMGNEIGTLTDGGFQKFFMTPGGKRKPAQAEFGRSERRQRQGGDDRQREALRQARRPLR